MLVVAAAAAHFAAVAFYVSPAVDGPPVGASSRSAAEALGSLEVSEPTAAELGPIGPVLAAAFLDDPVWTAIGPRPAATGR